MHKALFSLSCLALLLSGAALQSCVGGASNIDAGQGKAEHSLCLADQVMHDGVCRRPDQICSQLMIDGACYADDPMVSLTMISADLSEVNVFTDEPWDPEEEGSDAASLPDPQVNFVFSENASGETLAPGVAPLLENKNQPEWARAPFSTVVGTPLVTPLSVIMNPYNVIQVFEWDDEPDNVLMGQCSLDPTDVELATGVIRAKDCFSASRENPSIKKNGAESNLRELVIGIKVVE